MFQKFALQLLHCTILAHRTQNMYTVYSKGVFILQYFASDNEKNWVVDKTLLKTECFFCALLQAAKIEKLSERSLKTKF